MVFCNGTGTGLPANGDTDGKGLFREMNYLCGFCLCQPSVDDEPYLWIYQAVKPETDFEPMINIAHNYAAWENHFDQDVIVHRKGATRAYEGEIGIIPGSMVLNPILLRDWVTRRVSKAVRMVQVD